MTVGEISNEAVTAGKEDSVSEAATKMDSEDVGALVVEEDGAIAGIITDREIAMAVPDHDGNLSDTTAGDVMTEEIHTLQENEESIEAARTMAENGVRRIPVIDDSESLTGLVSLDDVVALTGEQLGDAATVIEKQSPGYEP